MSIVRLPGTVPAPCRLGVRSSDCRSLLSPTSLAAAITVLAIAFAVTLGVIGMRWPEGRKAPGPIAVSGFILAVNAAALRAWAKALRGERNPIWEPTRRPGAPADVSGPAAG